MMDKTIRSAFAPPDVEQLPMEHAARQSSIFWGIAAGIAMIGIRLMAVFTPPLGQASHWLTSSPQG